LKIPLFPLRTVLYPGGPLPLRIFESRYLDMISGCLKSGEPFGVLLIKNGDEAGEASTYSVGTLASITDWYQGSDGLLGVTAVGDKRFRLLATERQPDGLLMGEVVVLEGEPKTPIPEKFQPLSKILAGILDDLGKLYQSFDRHYDDASWVGYRFAEILPVGSVQKQFWLENDEPLQRLELINRVLREVHGPTTTA
jgi:Lon protease-like protein